MVSRAPTGKLIGSGERAVIAINQASESGKGANYVRVAVSRVRRRFGRVHFRLLDWTKKKSMRFRTRPARGGSVPEWPPTATKLRESTEHLTHSTAMRCDAMRTLARSHLLRLRDESARVEAARECLCWRDRPFGEDRNNCIMLPSETQRRGFGIAIAS